MPVLRAGVYRHWKGHRYQLLGLARDANIDGREVVVYVGLELDGATSGVRMHVREVSDFVARVRLPDGTWVPRFTYVGDRMDLGDTPLPDVGPKRRLRACVEAWPEAQTGDFDPRCCRWPKSCSATVYPDSVADGDLEEQSES